MNAEEKFNKLGMKKQVEDGIIEYTDGNTFIAFFKNRNILKSKMS